MLHALQGSLLTGCFICRRLLLFKFRKGLKRLQLTDNEISDTFKRLASAGSNELSPDLFHNALTRELDVVLTSGVMFRCGNSWSPILFSNIIVAQIGNCVHDASP